MIKRIGIVWMVIAILFLVTACGGKYCARAEAKKQERIIHAYLLSKYNLKCSVIKKWVGKVDLTAGRQPDVFVLKEEIPGSFAFKMMIYENHIEDGYPTAFMGSVVETDLVQYLWKKIPNKVQKMKCHAQIYTESTELLDQISEIESLKDRKIDVKLYIVVEDCREVCEEVIGCAFEHLQESFSDFSLCIYILQEHDYNQLEPILDECTDEPISLAAFGVEPDARFEYYMPKSEEKLQRKDLLNIIQYKKE